MKIKVLVAHVGLGVCIKWNGGHLVKVTPTPRELIFVRPLHRYWRRELLRMDSKDTEMQPNPTSFQQFSSSGC